MRSEIEFKNFVAQQHRPASSDGPDWHRERDEWLGYLQQLYDQIAEYLQEYLKDGSVKLISSVIELNEENIGVYEAKRLIIEIGVQQILFTPVGTRLIGSKGRVDVEGSAGKSRLALIDTNITDPRQMASARVTTIPRSLSPPPPAQAETDWVWKIVGRPPAMRLTELNKESFFELLMEVSNG